MWTAVEIATTRGSGSNKIYASTEGGRPVGDKKTLQGWPEAFNN